MMQVMTVLIGKDEDENHLMQLHYMSINSR
jgi:hypothetical protein